MVRLCVLLRGRGCTFVRVEVCVRASGMPKGNLHSRALQSIFKQVKYNAFLQVSGL
jgi:hypothetical protein